MKALQEQANQWGQRQASVWELENFISNTHGFLEVLAHVNGDVPTHATQEGKEKELTWIGGHILEWEVTQISGFIGTLNNLK